MSDEVEFFAGHRREIIIGGYHIRKPEGSEKRATINISLPLSNQPMTGMPEWIAEGNALVVKENSLYKKAVLDKIVLEGISIAFHSTPSMAKTEMQLHGCTMDKFSVEREGKEDKSQTYLNFVISTPASQDINTWLYGMMGATSFADFDTTQADFAYGGEEDEEQISLLPGADEPDNEDSPAAQERRRLDKLKAM